MRFVGVIILFSLLLFSCSDTFYARMYGQNGCDVEKRFKKKDRVKSDVENHATQGTNHFRDKFRLKKGDLQREL